MVLPIGASVLAGMYNASLLVVLNAVVQTANRTGSLGALGYAAICAATFASGVFSQLLLGRLGQSWAFDLRMHLCSSILETPFEKLQRLAKPRILASLTADVDAITSTYMVIPSIVMNVVTALGCLVYLGWLSPVMLVLVALCVSAGLIVVKHMQSSALNALGIAREKTDNLFEHFRALTDGIKELKMNAARRQAFLHDQLFSTASQVKTEINRGLLRYTLADHTCALFFHVSVGLVLFLAPLIREISPQTTIAYALGLFYLALPLSQLVQSLPAIGEGIVALNKISSLGLSLGPFSGPCVAIKPSGPQPDSFTLRFTGVQYYYAHKDTHRGFSLGPIDLTLRSGELVFFIGGNGSGKSTLAMLLAGLYQPEHGEIHINGQRIAEISSEVHREQVAAVFAEPFVFDTILSSDNVSKEQHAQKLILEFQLQHKTQIQNGRFTTLQLSQGQRKRVALMLAYLDDRPFYLFDEWAAGQDPVFKEIFYTKLLPDLKRRGKTVVVITHDDKYYYVADRLLKLTDGRLAE